MGSSLRLSARCPQRPTGCLPQSSARPLATSWTVSIPKRAERGSERWRQRSCNSPTQSTTPFPPDARAFCTTIGTGPQVSNPPFTSAGMGEMSWFHCISIEFANCKPKALWPYGDSANGTKSCLAKAGIQTTPFETCHFLSRTNLPGPATVERIGGTMSWAGMMVDAAEKGWSTFRTRNC